MFNGAWGAELCATSSNLKWQALSVSKQFGFITVMMIMNECDKVYKVFQMKNDESKHFTIITQTISSEINHELGMNDFDNF